MAIYHLNVRGCSPATGAGAVRKAAYQSGQALVEERTGDVCDYARKERVLDEGIELPEGAPALSRERLWNMAERQWAEDGGGKSLVAKRIEFALPRELPADQRRQCVLDMCARLTAEGRACDWAIHDTRDGGNPHAHILVSAQRLTADGFEPRARGAKGECWYLCKHESGTISPIRAAAWKQAKADGWAKLYNFKDGERRTMKEAKALDLGTKDRTSPRPVQMHRTEGQSALDVEKAELVSLRAAWERIANRHIVARAAETGVPAQTIDHRSNAARGLDELPTVHEGGAGLIGHTERVQRNREIKERNERLRVLKAELAREEAEIADLEREVEQAKRKARTAEGFWRERPRKGERQRKAAVAKRRRQAMATASAKAQAERRMAKAKADTAETSAVYAEQLDEQIAALGEQIRELQAAPSTKNLERAVALAADRKALMAERAGIKPAEPTVKPPEQGQRRGPRH